jgi:hypothetical protein
LLFSTQKLGQLTNRNFFIMFLKTADLIVKPGGAAFGRRRESWDGAGGERKVIVLFEATWLIWGLEFT